MFEDIISIEAELRQLKIENEKLAKLVEDYKGMTNILQKQRQEFIYLLKEASFYMKEFEAILPEKNFKECEKRASKQYENWIKKEFEFDSVSVDVVLQT